MRPGQNLLLGVLCCLILVGCTETRHDGLRFGLAAMPVTLDPRYATDAASSRINRLIYDRLVDFDDSLTPVPALASWQRLSPRHYRFTLERAAKFSNGAALTMADVQATYTSILDPKQASPHRMSLSNIRSLDVVDSRVMDVLLEKPDLLFPGRLSIGILPAQLIAGAHTFNTRPVGSGAFEFVEWPDEGHLLLKRKRDGLRLAFIAVKDPTVRVLKLVRGEIDMLQNDLPPELIDYLDKQPGIHIQRAAGSKFAYLGFNLDDPVSGNPALRRAIAIGIDRAAIIDHVLGGAARPATSLLPPDHWAGNPNLEAPRYDPERARAILTEAGLTGAHRPELVYKTSNDPFRLRIATILQQQLARIGIDVTLRSYDWGTFYGDIKAGRFQMYSLMWVGIKLPDIFRYVFHSEAIPPDGANRGRYRSAEVDRLIERAERAGTLAEAVNTYRAVQARVMQDLPYVPLWYEDNVFVRRDTVMGYRIAMDGNFDGLKQVKSQ